MGAGRPMGCVVDTGDDPESKLVDACREWLVGIPSATSGAPIGVETIGSCGR